MNPNNYNNQKIRGQKRKLEAIQLLGGKCSICGYNKNIAALDFHHLKQSQKEFQIDSRKFANTSTKKIKEELDKCILVCANCHRELHNPYMTFDTVQDLAENSNKKGLDEKDYGQACLFCGKKFPKTKGKKYCSTASFSFGSIFSSLVCDSFIVYYSSACVNYLQ